MNRYDEMLEQAQIFHSNNPKVWALFCRFSLMLVDRGFKHYSANAVFERIRWETDQADHDGKTTFKLNNNHRPFYARAWMKKYPEHFGFFRVRVQTSKDCKAVHLPELRPTDFPYETGDHP